MEAKIGSEDVKEFEVAHDSEVSGYLQPKEFIADLPEPQIHFRPLSAGQFIDEFMKLEERDMKAVFGMLQVLVGFKAGEAE